MSEPAQRLKRLQAAANASARHTQRVHLVFILLCAYVALTLAATTHAQLLRDRGVELPVLGVSVPIVWFGLVAPTLLILLHAHLLLQIKLLSSTLTAVEHCASELHSIALRREQRSLLYPCLAAQVLLGHNGEGQTARLGCLIAWLTLLALPIVLLTWMVLTFVPYHHAGLIWLQRLALFVDLGLLWSVWGEILRTRPGRRRWPGGGDWRRYVGPAVATSASALVCFMALAVAVIPGERLESLTRGGRLRRIFRLTDRAFPRGLDLAAQTLVEAMPPPEVMAVYFQSGQDPQAAWRDYTRGLDLSGRDLRGANFADTRLVNADLRDSVLTGANLQRAMLRGVVFTAGAGVADDQDSAPALGSAQLKGATLRGADLEDVDLSGVALDGADLAGARLRGATLRRTVLRGAGLQDAEMQGANLMLADLAAADLHGAQLQGARLVRADLRGADLGDADLRGADLRGAVLDGASLHKTQLRSADLRGASLHSTCFASTDLALSDLRGAELGPLADADRRDLALAITRHVVADAPTDVDDRLPSAPSDELATYRVPALMRQSLKRVELALTQGCPTISRAEVIAAGAIYDRSGALGDWPAPPDPTVHARDRAAYLADLACTDARVARSLARQDTAEAAASDPATVRDENAARLPGELLARHCPAVEQLPEDVRAALEEVRSHQPTAPPARLARSSPPPTTLAARDRRKRSR
jgi:uncharacterized protein YjbI with pentapeptide repeats